MGLAHPLQDEFESDPFAVAAPGCSAARASSEACAVGWALSGGADALAKVTLRLRADGQRCHLELSGSISEFFRQWMGLPVRFSSVPCGRSTRHADEA